MTAIYFLLILSCVFAGLAARIRGELTWALAVTLALSIIGVGLALHLHLTVF
jgi:hypothetical protein